jgi:hypothetical protein
LHVRARRRSPVPAEAGCGAGYPTRPGDQQRGGELGEDGQVYVQLHPDQSPHPQREHRPLVLQVPELPLDRTALVVVALPPVGAARDQGVQPVGLESYGGGLALPDRAAPLGRAALGVRARERPLAVLARRGLVLACLDGQGLPQRDHGPDVPAFEYRIEGFGVVARSSAATCAANPRSRAESSSADTIGILGSLAVFTSHASGSPVAVSTAQCTLYP